MPFELINNTINEFHNEVVRRFRDRPFLYFVDDEPISYGEYARRVRALRIKIINAGLCKADPVVLLGPASPNWAISFMAVMSAGLVVVPVMEDFPDTDIDHIISDSGARCAIVSPAYAGVNGLSSLNGLPLFSLNNLEQIKETSERVEQKKNPGSYFTDMENPENVKADDDGCFPTSPSDVAELLYTSGTTGHSKAVMLTHNNLVTNLYEGTDLIDECFDEQTILMSLLPMAHAYGSTSAFLSIMYKGPRICFLKRKPTPEYLQTVFRKVQPTILGGVPLIFEKIFQKKIQPMIQSRKILAWGVENSVLFRRFFYRLAGRSVLKYFGGKIRCIIIGGATFSEQVEVFMRESGIPYLLGYGLSETSPLLTFSTLKESRFGSVGHAVRDTEIRITNPDGNGIGDIEVTGPQVMKGYYGRDDENNAVFCDDGWFRTGDRGFLDNDGFLYIRGRSKNVIVGSSGENIYPEIIETMLNAHDLIEESLVYMNGSSLTAIIFADPELAGERFNNDEKALIEALEDIKTEVNKGLSMNSRISGITLRTEAFEKTPTRKIRRALYIPDY